MELSTIEYNAVMMAIDSAKNAIADDTFIDHYADNPDGYTNKILLAALNSIEDKIISLNPTTL